MSDRNSFIERLAKLAESGQPFVHVTLVEAIGSTPQDRGTKMLVNENGLVDGTVGGGKIEAQAIDYAHRMLATDQTTMSEFVEWNLQSDVGMTCGGLVKLFFEAYNRDEWRVVIFGAGHVAQALAKCLLTLPCKIVCVDSRQDWIERFPASPNLTKVCMPEVSQFVEQLRASDNVICMTMGHSTDRPVLEKIFKSDLKPNYLGVIGSKTKKGVLVRELTECGLDRSVAEGFTCPIGMKIGTNQPGEIAISIVAQLLERRDAIRSGNKV